MGEAAMTIPEPQPEALAMDSIIRLDGVGWADYQRLLAIRGERSVPRLTYLAGALELMSPSITHESIKSMLGRLIEAWCFENKLDITPYGSWTLENKESLRGVEPDECYVLGDTLNPVCCDLAIEVIWTSGSINKLDVYLKLGVQEVWIWKDGAIRVYCLSDEKYQEHSASDLLAGIDLPQLLEYIETRPMTRAVREYRAALSDAKTSQP